MSAPRPFETDSFHLLGSICNIKQLLYICKNLPVISSMWDAQVCIEGNALEFTVEIQLVKSMMNKVCLCLS